jgi:hypothetical protein
MHSELARPGQAGIMAYFRMLFHHLQGVNEEYKKAMAS